MERRRLRKAEVRVSEPYLNHKPCNGLQAPLVPTMVSLSVGGYKLVGVISVQKSGARGRSGEVFEWSARGGNRQWG
jgi:hypothetical protein